MDKTRIFISYRREDTAPYAGRIYDRLVMEFGVEQVFYDLDTIPPGDDFVEVLTEKVESCDVLLAVIGKSWLTPRIHNPEDFLVIEIGAALRRKVRVIPILVGGGRMPVSSELPDSLLSLARRNAYELPEKGFISTLEKLFPVIQKAQGSTAGAHAGNETTAAPVQPKVAKAGARKINPRDGLTYIWIPPGSFAMGRSPGDTECQENEKPTRLVEITKGFWIGETPVTQDAYQHVMGSNPSHFRGPKRPVENVSWDDGIRYCQAAGARLPTEAEWEYAARAGTAAARYGDLDEIAWYGANSEEQTLEVKRKRPNALGLYDTLGNVWEWVADWYDESYYRRNEALNPVGPKDGIYKVVRGGSWNSNPMNARASYRFWLVPAYRNTVVGFRCVCVT
jgi:formylglycine-generating enzyme required for sulfatase activity